jgi:hypothetical protein
MRTHQKINAVESDLARVGERANRNRKTPKPTHNNQGGTDHDNIDRGSGCVGRCDAKCYDAQTENCDCICGGRNHGAGLEKAIENTRNHVEEWVEEYAEEKGLTKYRTKLNRELVDQFSLFDVKSFTNTIAIATQDTSMPMQPSE